MGNWKKETTILKMRKLLVYLSKPFYHQAWPNVIYLLLQKPKCYKNAISMFSAPSGPILAYNISTERESLHISKCVNRLHLSKQIKGQLLKQSAGLNGTSCMFWCMASWALRHHAVMCDHAGLLSVGDDKLNGQSETTVSRQFQIGFLL